MMDKQTRRRMLSVVPGPGGKVDPAFERLLSERFGAELRDALTRLHRVHLQMQMREAVLLAKIIVIHVEMAERRLAGYY